MVHTIAAQDGSWATGPLKPAEAGGVTFDKPGTYTYICKEHPWSHGQIVVVAENRGGASGVRASSSAGDNDKLLDRATEAYNIDQSRRGKLQFEQVCSSCHGDDLNGGNIAPGLFGSSFLRRWDGQTAGDLFERIRTTMPLNNPGSLSPQAYADILAFLLQSNSFPVGSQELKGRPETLGKILIQKNKDLPIRQ
jgi:quinoprotein glucose dehydrogenase